MLKIVAVFLFLALLFGALEALWPAIRGQKHLRSGLLTDLIYFVFNPLVTNNITRFAILLILLPLLWLAGQGVDRESILAGFGPVSRLPVWQQVVGIVVLGDFIGYWCHRAFHHRWLWRFHAVHHSSEKLDWAAAARVHPVNDILMGIGQAVPLVLLGFPPLAAAAYAPLFTLYAISLHANLNWDWGPLRKVLSSPRFHRWHHTSEDEGRDKNFSGLLPLWDIVFGTYYMPGREPMEFGVHEPVPKTFWAQLWWPFRKAEPRP